jgi:hypothetical protein
MPDAAEESGVYGSEEMVDVKSLQIRTGECGENFRGMYGGNLEAKPRVKIGRISAQTLETLAPSKIKMSWTLGGS